MWLCPKDGMIDYMNYREANGANPGGIGSVSGVLSYRLTSGETPQLIWQVRSLQSVLRLSYAAMVTGGKPGLRVCKNCGKLYYNSHAKSEFCSTRCRNYYIENYLETGRGNHHDYWRAKKQN